MMSWAEGEETQTTSLSRKRPFLWKVYTFYGSVVTIFRKIKILTFQMQIDFVERLLHLIKWVWVVLFERNRFFLVLQCLLQAFYCSRDCQSRIYGLLYSNEAQVHKIPGMLEAERSASQCCNLDESTCDICVSGAN